MKTTWLLLWTVLCVPLGYAAERADGVDVFQAGLRAFQANGPDALLRTWYSAEEPEKVADLRKKLGAMSHDLGEVVDTEVFAPRNLGRHVQRLYGVIYFRKRPLWLRAEYYSIDGRSGFIALEFSKTADDILPLAIGVDSH
ncbi:MAG TPA: hypothetical protein VGD81_10690 [Opitutaceae bacterium]